MGGTRVMTTPPSPAAGWYPDPEGEARLRYFDGGEWTASYAPSSTAKAVPWSWSQRPKWLVPTLIVGGLVALVAIANDGGDSGSSKPVSSTLTSTVTVTAQPTTVTQTVTLAAPPPPVLDPSAVLAEPPVAEPPAVEMPAEPPAVEMPAGTQPQPFAPLAPQAPASAYYGNCAAARAAGAAPLHVGDPGYRAGLDRDGDGIACE